MTGFLTPLINIYIAMGASIFSAYLLVILTIAFIGAIIGGIVSEGSPEATKLGGIVGFFFFGIAFVIAEIFPK